MALAEIVNCCPVGTGSANAGKPAAAMVARQPSCSARVRALRTALGTKTPARPAEYALNCENNSLTPFAPNFGNGYVLSQTSW